MRMRLLLALPFALVAVACRPQPETVPATAPVAKAPATQTVSTALAASDLVGVFAAKGIRLELLADGRYRLRVRAESAGADLDSEGHWTLPSSDHLQLDPNDPSEPGRDYLVWSRDGFEANDGSYSLIRQNSPAGTDAVAVVDNTPMAHVDAASGAQLDGKSLAGKFSDGESVLELRADGSYVQTLQVAGSAIDSDGHWAPDGEHALKLDPNSKQAEDVRFEVVSADLLKGADGREFKRVAE